MTWGPPTGKTFTLQTRTVFPTANGIITGTEETPEGLVINFEPATPQDAETLDDWEILQREGP